MVDGRPLSSLARGSSEQRRGPDAAAVIRSSLVQTFQLGPAEEWEACATGNPPLSLLFA